MYARFEMDGAPFDIPGGGGLLFLEGEISFGLLD